jgi:hypothetical protein
MKGFLSSNLFIVISILSFIFTTVVLLVSLVFFSKKIFLKRNNLQSDVQKNGGFDTFSSDEVTLKENEISKLRSNLILKKNV